MVSESKDIVEIASPRGVVCGIIPSTNPTSTAIFKILIAIKSRNTIVLSPHPGTVRAQTRITLPRPRDPLSVAFLDYQKTIVSHLGSR